MKKMFLLYTVAALSFLSFGHAYAASGPTKYVVVAGSGGLDTAAKECAPFLGQPSWQACVAHHDGLYTPASDGSINRNYVRDELATKPNSMGPVECEAEFVKMPNGDIGWALPTNPKCKWGKK